MPAGVVAFLGGVVALQWCRELPPLWLVGGSVALLPFVWLPKFIPSLISRVMRRVIRWTRLPVCVWLGFTWALLRAHLLMAVGLPPVVEGEPALIRGVVVGLPRSQDGRGQFEFEISEMTTLRRDWSSPGRVRLAWFNDAPVLRAGQQWQLMVRLKRPHGMMNPGGFDYETWLFQHRVRATGYVLNNYRNQMIGERVISLDRLRGYLRERILRALPESDYRGIVLALALGDRTEISRAQWELLRHTGTAHLIAISGLHIGLVAGLVFYLVRRIAPVLRLSVAAPRVAALGGIAAAAGYAALAGFAIPTQRALVMVAVALCGSVIGRRFRGHQAIATAVLVIVVMDPLAVVAIGFWLSFAAVSVLLLVIRGRVGPLPKWRALGSLQVALACGMAPLSLALFHQTPLLAPFANGLAVPLVGFLLVPLILLGIAMLLVSTAAGVIFLTLAVRLLELLWLGLAGLAELPFGLWHGAITHWWVALAALLGVLLLLMPRGLPGRWLGMVWLAPLAFAPVDGPPVGGFQMDVLDVGQGLSVVVRTRQHVLVYDTGPITRAGSGGNAGFDAGVAVLVPYLRSERIQRVDMLMLSHGDTDHVGGARSFLDTFTPRTILLSDRPPWLATRAVRCRFGQSWRWDGVEFRVLHPGGSPVGGLAARNDNSCVISIESRDGSVLLAGDIEAAAERELLQRAGSALSADVLIVPHHGSRTSSTPAFVGAVAPRYALFGVGHRNRFGFPHTEVVRRYRTRGTILGLTGRDGALRLTVDHRGITYRAYRAAKRRYWHAHAELVAF